MIVNLPPVHLENIKSLTLSVAGIKNMSPMDCRVLSASILEKTKLSVSETTLKRLFGFARSKFNPSLFTLNAVAIYCGYRGWEDFQRSQPNEAAGSGHPTLDLFHDPMFFALLETATPILILETNRPDFKIITYNKAYEDVTHTQNRELRGLTLWQAFDPEKSGGYGPTLLLEALNEAIQKKLPVQMQPLHYNIPSILPNIIELNWWDVKIVPVMYDGVIKYLLLNTHNITDKVLHQDAIEQAIMKELTLAEDLAKSNIKLNVALENLAASHRELNITKNQLEEINKNLEQRVIERTKKIVEKEAIQRKLIDNSPVAFAVLKGPDHVVETANKRIIEYWGKDETLINKPLSMAIPELKGQPFIEILDKVRNTGIPYINKELRALLNFNGILQPRYYDMVYQPIQHAPGVTDRIFIVAVDITEHVIARQNLEKSESMLRLAVNAANIGTWSFDPQEKVMRYNEMFAKLLGWEGDEIMTYENAIAQVTDEFREKIVEVIESAIADGGDYDFIYAQKRFNDGEVIWLRATGRISPDKSDHLSSFSGIVRQIAGNDHNL